MSTDLAIDTLIRAAALAVAVDGRNPTYTVPVPPGHRLVAGFPAGQPLGRGLHVRCRAAHIVAWCAAQDPEVKRVCVVEPGAPVDLTGWVEDTAGQDAREVTA